MKTITSVLGDRWVINDGKAKSELGTIEFSTNSDMMEMLEKAQVSEKWANRLRIIGKAELNEHHDAVYIPDKNNNNWFREVKLEDPMFRVGENDYFSGYDLTWPDDTRLKISEICASPGSSYGPYLIQCEREDGSMGLVGYCDTESEVLPALELLKDTKLNPLPNFVEHKNVLMDLPEGYKAEINKSVSYYNDVVNVCFPTAIIYPGEAIAMVATLYPDTLLSMRDSAEFLHKVLDDGEGRRTKSYGDELKKLNNRLMQFRKTELFEPRNQAEFTEALSKLKKDSNLKVKTVDNEQELLISWKQVKNWRHMNDKIIPDDELFDGENLKANNVESVRLCFEREYTVQVKQADGFLVLEGSGKAINADRLYSLISDPAYLEQAITSSHKDGTTYKVFAQEAILSTVRGSTKDIEYTSEKTFTLAAAIKKVKNEMDKAISSYGMDVA